MANHGRTGFSRWIYGSVCEKILQAAKCPVLISRHTS
jgi:nucleotide-binding universal stress UspA family protein